MTNKSTLNGLGIALGALLGAVFGVLAGHVGIWLAIGVAIGMLLGAIVPAQTNGLSAMRPNNRARTEKATHDARFG